MCERAAKTWECEVADVEYQADGSVKHKSDADKHLTFQQIAMRQNATGGPITASSGVNPGGAGPSLATHIVDVEVDPTPVK